MSRALNPISPAKITQMHSLYGNAHNAFPQPACTASDTALFRGYTRALTVVSLTDLYAHFADHDAILDVFWIILLKDMKMWYTVSVNKALTTHAITGIKVNQRKDTKKKERAIVSTAASAFFARSKNPMFRSADFRSFSGKRDSNFSWLMMTCSSSLIRVNGGYKYSSSFVG